MAIFISFFCALFFLENVILRTSLPWSWLGILIGAGVAILALGVGDDRFGIHAEKKLYGQLIVIVGLMLFGQRLDTVVLPLVGTVELGGWAWPFTLFWYLGFINSMNLIDGLDGLASGISIVAALALMVISLAVGEMFSTLFAATLCGATVAFFYWNISKRKIFLGDSGSMWMGLVLASLLLNLSQKVPISLPVMVAPMIVPIWDTGHHHRAPLPSPVFHLPGGRFPPAPPPIAPWFFAGRRGVLSSAGHGGNHPVRPQ